ncbi:uncharacterized protein LOC117174113 [Belonocnema kinseyi]|uniref:uncharacterized protein LOC117174113 n=1 Tax=Belonocnema kinseyi TaxID=2817044 RepID=UPI00143D7BE0|nr:uncharacterized protein LOC117174113 [Belonocnema kinseyi]
MDIFTPDKWIIDKLAKVLDKYENPFLKDAAAVHIEGVDLESLITFCLADSDLYNGYDKKYHTAKDQYGQCHDEPLKTGDTEVRHKCRDKIMATFEKETKLYIDKATACVAKCVKLGAGCKKMLQEL